MDQISFTDTEYATKPKQTRREKFLGEMAQVVPWSRLEGLIKPYYPRAGNARPPYPLLMMLRLSCLQHWHDSSDPGMEEIRCRTAMRRFARCALDRGGIPDESIHSFNAVTC